MHSIKFGKKMKQIESYKRNLKYINEDAKKRVLKTLGIGILRYIALIPLMVIYSLIIFPLLLLVMVCIGGKHTAETVNKELNPKGYWDIRNLFEAYYLCFKCSKCGEEKAYFCDVNQAESEYKRHKEKIWNWYDNRESRCINCIKKETHTN